MATKNNKRLYRQLWHQLKESYQLLCYTIAIDSSNDSLYYRELGMLVWLDVYFTVSARKNADTAFLRPLNKLFNELWRTYKHKGKVSHWPVRLFLRQRRKYRVQNIYMIMAYLEQILIKEGILKK